MYCSGCCPGCSDSWLLSSYFMLKFELFVFGTDKVNSLHTTVITAQSNYNFRPKLVKLEYFDFWTLFESLTGLKCLFVNILFLFVIWMFIMEYPMLLCFIEVVLLVCAGLLYWFEACEWSVQGRYIEACEWSVQGRYIEGCEWSVQGRYIEACVWFATLLIWNTSTSMLLRLLECFFCATTVSTATKVDDYQ